MEELFFFFQKNRHGNIAGMMTSLKIYAFPLPSLAAVQREGGPRILPTWHHANPGRIT